MRTPNYADGRFIVYGLRDPMVDEIRYVGRSSSGLNRAKHHAMPSVLSKDKTAKGKWVRSLVANGTCYEIIVLENVGCEERLSDAERFWIFDLRASGTLLVNEREGGLGTPKGHKPSPETCAKLSAAMKGRKKSPEAEARRLASRRAGGWRPSPENVEKFREITRAIAADPERMAKRIETRRRNMASKAAKMAHEE